MSAEEIGWDVPGWDWADADYAWLDSHSGIYDNETRTSVFFIHGGRVRHQSHLPEGVFTRDELLRIFDEKAQGLDDPRLVWYEDTGGGSAGVWVEGTRPPNGEDRERLQSARERSRHEDRVNYMMIRKRHPEWFVVDVALDEYGRPT